MITPLRGRDIVVLAVIIAVALLLRLGVAAGLKSHRYIVETGQPPRSEAEYLKSGDIRLGDSQQYELLGRSLMQGRYAWDETPNTFRTPGYPLLIALVRGNLILLLVAQALLGAVAVFLTALIGRRLFGDRAGFVAAGLLALDVPSVFFAGVVMSETLLVVILLLALWLFLRGHEPLAGLVLGFAVLVRPVAVLVVLPFAVALALRREWRRLGLTIALFLLLPGAWTARNYAHFHRAGLTSNGGYNLYYCNAVALLAEQSGIDRDSARMLLAARFAARHPGNNPLQLGDELTRAGLGIIARDPVRYALLHLRGTARVLGGVKSDDLVRSLTQDTAATIQTDIITRLQSTGFAARLLAFCELFVTMAAVLLAVAALRRRYGRGARLLLLAAAVCFILAGSPFPDGRFRVPAMPFIFLAAASILGQGPVRAGKDAARLS